MNTEDWSTPEVEEALREHKRQEIAAIRDKYNIPLEFADILHHNGIRVNLPEQLELDFGENNG